MPHCHHSIVKNCLPFYFLNSTTNARSNWITYSWFLNLIWWNILIWTLWNGRVCAHFTVKVCEVKLECICVCLCARVCTYTCLLDTCCAIFVACSSSSCHCISLYSCLFFLFAFLFPSLSYLFLFVCLFFCLFLAMCSLLSQCPAHPCDIMAGSVQSAQLLVKGVNETLVAQRVVPALITLSSDPEM